MTVSVLHNMKTGFLITWIAAMCVALAFAFKPQALELGIEGSDKILHMLAFLLLTIMPVIAFEKMRSIVIGVSLIFAIGIFIEYAQMFIPTRYPEVMDAVFNVMGVGVGTMIGLSLRSTYQALIPAVAQK